VGSKYKARKPALQDRSPSHISQARPMECPSRTYVFAVVQSTPARARAVPNDDRAVDTGTGTPFFHPPLPQIFTAQESICKQPFTARPAGALPHQTAPHPTHSTEKPCADGDGDSVQRRSHSPRPHRRRRSGARPRALQRYAPR
jgi:hypothetical protein